MSNRARFLTEYSQAVADESAAVFVGAGVSVGAGYPSWKDLLKDIGEELGVKADDVHDLAALAQWSVSESGSSTKIRRVIREQISPKKAVPDTLKVICRLPIRHIWTTNYDRLVESAFEEIARPLDAISAQSDLALRARAGAARLYKMHGSIDRLDDVVISTDDYELFRSKRGAFLPLLQAHLTSYSMLFVGLSFSDPNLRHVLSVIRESFTEAPPEHFAIVRPPQRVDYNSESEFSARLRQHQLWALDLRRYGLIAVEINAYSEVPALLGALERKVAARRVWVSGSCSGSGQSLDFPLSVADQVGRYIGVLGLTLVSGGGVGIGSYVLSGFLSALQASNAWDLERRLIVRPFPQIAAGAKPSDRHWTKLREELGRLSGTVVFISGLKESNGRSVDAPGVLEEFAIAEKNRSFLVPVGATGGAAAKIAEKLVGSPLTYQDGSPRRPSDKHLRELMNASNAEAATVLIGQLLSECAN